MVWFASPGSTLCCWLLFALARLSAALALLSSWRRRIASVLRGGAPLDVSVGGFRRPLFEHTVFDASGAHHRILSHSRARDGTRACRRRVRRALDARVVFVDGSPSIDVTDHVNARAMTFVEGCSDEAPGADDYIALALAGTRPRPCSSKSRCIRITSMDLDVSEFKGMDRIHW